MEYKIITKPKVKEIGYHRLIGKNKVGIYIEKDIPKKWVKPIVYHEKVEDVLQRKGLPHKSAHLITTHLEHKKFFSHNPQGWKKELNWVHNTYEKHK